MNIRKTVFLFLCSFLFLFSERVFSETDLLKEGDIPTIMERLLEYHIDQKTMNADILKRSFKVFIKQFDPKRIYLTKKEILPYLNPTKKNLKQTLNQYKEKGMLAAYRQLAELIHHAIYRSRTWRKELFQKKHVLFSKAKENEKNVEEEKKWVDSENNLKKNLKRQIVAFIRSHLDSAKDRSLPDFENRVIQLYEKRTKSQENEYLFCDMEGKELEKEESEHFLVLKVLKSLAKSLDSHTSFFSGQEAYDMRVQLEKGFHGIGVILQENITGPTITRLIKGGPADRVGTIQVDDTIVEVDGNPVNDYPFKKILEMIRGEKGSKITLGLQRIEKVNGEAIAKSLNVDLIRGKVILDEKRVDIDYESFADGIIGKITLYSFYGGDDVSSEKDVRKAIQTLRKKGKLKGLVLDLRDNLGGFLMQAVKVAGLFISNGVVVVAKYSDGESKYFRDVDGYTHFDGPLVVLTSKASASASEIVAQTLQDYGTAIIVGDEHTYGKGSIQHQTVTEKNSWAFFKVTVGRYYTVSGKSTQIEGVLADIVVPSKYHNKNIGEKHLDYPLPNDEIPSTYKDALTDLSWDSKRWYVKYYLPSLQKPLKKWREMLPLLRKNSERRLENNKNYHLFLYNEDFEKKEDIFQEKKPRNFGIEDLQMREAVNILKDMAAIRSQEKEEKKRYAFQPEKSSVK